MKYRIYAIKNPCGFVEGQWYIEQNSRHHWVYEKPLYSTFDINQAYASKQTIEELPGHLPNCSCSFEVQLIEDSL